MTTSTIAQLSAVDLAAFSVLGRRFDSGCRASLPPGSVHDVDLAVRIVGKITVGKLPAPRQSGGDPAAVLGFVLQHLTPEARARVCNAVMGAAATGGIQCDANSRELAKTLVDLTKTKIQPAASVGGVLEVLET